MEYYNNDYLMHYGVKGMKWGVRRYQNADGTLTAKGRKKISKQYDKESKKVMNELSRRGNKIHLDAYNKAADKMNKGGIDKFNEAQQKKYGKDYAKRDNYVSDYNKMFEKEVVKNMNRSLLDFYNSNKNYKKAQALVDKYDMTKWDDLAKSNSEAVQSLRDALRE